MNMRSSICLALGLVLAAPALIAQTPATDANNYAVYQLPEAKRITLPNGLVLLLLEKHDLPLTSVQIGLRTGSLLDPDGKPGVSSIVAEQLRKGTTTQTADQLSDAIDFLGMQFGAASRTESTVIYGDFLSKDTDKALGLIADMTLHPIFPPDELKRTIAQRQERLKTDKDNVYLAVNQYYLATLYAGHPYARSLLASEASLASITHDDVVSFHQRVYTPANAVIAAVGDFNSADMQAKLTKLFGAWKGAAPAPVTVPVMRPVAGRNVLLVDKPDATQTYFIIGNVGLSETDPDRAPAHVVNTLYGGRFNSLFNEELRIKSGYSYSAYSHFEEDRTPGPFSMASYTKNATTAPAIDKTFEVIATLHTHPFTEADLTSAKNYIRGTFPPTLETSPDLAAQLVTDEIEGISREQFNTKLVAEQATTLAEANRVIDKDFPGKDNYVLVIVGKASEIGSLAAKYGTVTQKKISDPGY
jgi:predicted Zn-dependent peptidase